MLIINKIFVDKNIHDIKQKVFSEDIEIFYSLFNIYDPENIDSLSIDCLVGISMLAKFTKVFGSHYIYGKINNFLKNENVLFITALLLKVSLIIKKYCLAVSLIQNYFLCNNYKLYNLQVQEISDKSMSDNVNCHTAEKIRGICILPINAFFKHSCNPNVSFLFTEDNKLIYYCIEPIKKFSVVSI